MKPKTEKRKVCRKGIAMFGEYWYNDALFEHVGEVVEIVYAAKGFDVYYRDRFICYIQTRYC